MHQRKKVHAVDQQVVVHTGTCSSDLFDTEERGGSDGTRTKSILISSSVFAPERTQLSEPTHPLKRYHIQY